MQIKTPATNYVVNIENIYEVGDEIWVVARLKRIGEVGGDAITTVTDKQTIDARPGNVTTYVLGKTWIWEDPEIYEYPSDDVMETLLEEQRKAGKVKEIFGRNR